MGLSDDDTGYKLGEMKPDGKRKTPVPDGGEGPLDRILSGLIDSRRRYLLYYLGENEDAYITEAAKYVTACEQQCELEDVPDGARERVKIDLYHGHLPQLADSDLIEYDQRSGAIRFRDPPDQLRKFLELAEDTEDIDTPDPGTD